MLTDWLSEGNHNTAHLLLGFSGQMVKPKKIQGWPGKIFLQPSEHKLYKVDMFWNVWKNTITGF